jgi:hypothetical protein
MRTAPRRETLIALKAAHTAIRVARDIGYPQIDVMHFLCEGCGVDLDWQGVVGPNYIMFCPDCGQRNHVPCSLRPYVTPAKSPVDQAAETHIQYEFHPQPPSPPPEDLSMPRWLEAVRTACIILAGITGIIIACSILAHAMK